MAESEDEMEEEKARLELIKKAKEQDKPEEEPETPGKEEK